MKDNKPTLLLVDGHSLAFRSFYAFSKGGEGGLTTKEGFPTSVTYGFLKSLLDNCKQLSPQGVIITFDTAEPTFRHKADVNYKANRDVAPDIFFQDLAKLQLILEDNLNLPVIMQPGYEADDLLGTLASEASQSGWKVRILSGDRDLFQLVDDKKNIAVLYMGGGPYSKSGSPTLVDEKVVQTKLGVVPKRVVDLKALTGDSSDNIKGVKGIGPKTAINLLSENDSLDQIYQVLDELENQDKKASKGFIKGSIKEKLKSDKSSAYLSQYLAKIIIDVPIKNKKDFHLKKVDKSGLELVLQELELYSLYRQIPSFIAAFSEKGFIANNNEINTDKDVINKSNKINSEVTAVRNNSIPEITPKIITNLSELKNLLKILLNHKDKNLPVSIDTETTDLNPFRAELVGIGTCWGESSGDLAYIPIGHKCKENNALISDQIPLEDVINILSPWIESPDHPKALQNTKYDRLILLRHGISLEGVEIDTLLADYIKGANHKHSIDEIAKREFNFTPKSFKDIVNKGENFSDVDIRTASQYCGMDVYLTRKLALKLTADLVLIGDDSLSLLKKVEQPLEIVLASMEATGINIDINYLKELSLEMNSETEEIKNNIYKIAGLDFNLSSPKQLGDVLFERIGLDKKKSRRNKTGWSTDAKVLEKLQNDHEIIPLLIKHRTLSKLLSTYVNALPKLVEKETNRIHTDFNQAITATGRLSSSNPNLQNIPIRTEFSRRIRKAFLPEKNWKLLSADYSQIELRILAHLSGEEVLQNAYKKGEDVHALTAKLLLDKNEINGDERRIGKTINFGVIYGMGVQRFSRATGVSQIEAKSFLTKFKERYPKVFGFLEMQEKLALSQGYVSTILGRRRYFDFDKNGLGRLQGKNIEDIDLEKARRAGLEAQQLRAAANAPIQGSSADIIKIAMVQLYKKLTLNKYPAKLLLQVHDELVLEVEPSVIHEVEKLVITTMEGALKLKVPLIVETGIGSNWMEAK